MITPKTDIVQSVGRILRTKHSQPLIIDMVDMHTLFQNQWHKRRAYYKKCNYHIQMTDNVTYGSQPTIIWRDVYVPKKVGEEEEKKKPKCLIDIKGTVGSLEGGF